MQNWKGLMIGGVVAALIVVVFVSYASKRLDKEQALDPNGLVGRPAADFEGDFAVNGQPTRLSDLRGKVVLVDFWAVWCGPCIASFPHLRYWQDKFGKDGFQVVGLTMYNYEGGRYFGFDKEKGRLTQLPSGDKASEQAMLKDFAKHYKVDHLLMTLPGERMSKAQRDYEIEGYPTLCLVDRKGIIRAVGLGGAEQTIAEIEASIEKVVAEKG